MNIRSLGFFVITVLMSLSLWAQESEQTIEELYLQTPMRTLILKTVAESPDRESKSIALADILEMLDKGEEIDSEIVAILGDLAGESVTNVVMEQGYVTNDFPEVRMLAVRILSQIGTEEAAIELRSVLLNDPEPIVVAEAVLGLSRIEGIEDKKGRNQSLAASMYLQTALKKDNNVAYTFLESVEIVARREGGIDDLMVFEEVAKIADARQGYSRVVRNRAHKLLKDLQNM